MDNAVGVFILAVLVIGLLMFALLPDDDDPPP